jgi:hypothetical protein
MYGFNHSIFVEKLIPLISQNYNINYLKLNSLKKLINFFFVNQKKYLCNDPITFFLFWLKGKYFNFDLTYYRTEAWPSNVISRRGYFHIKTLFISIICHIEKKIITKETKIIYPNINSIKYINQKNFKKFKLRNYNYAIITNNHKLIDFNENNKRICCYYYGDVSNIRISRNLISNLKKYFDIICINNTFYDCEKLKFRYVDKKLDLIKTESLKKYSPFFLLTIPKKYPYYNIIPSKFLNYLNFNIPILLLSSTKLANKISTKFSDRIYLCDENFKEFNLEYFVKNYFNKRFRAPYLNIKNLNKLNNFIN